MNPDDIEAFYQSSKMAHNSLKDLAKNLEKLGLAMRTVDGMTVIDVMLDDERWQYSDNFAEWELELLVKGYEVDMMRLPRARKGKTPIDVGIVKQDDLTRVRISMGEDNSPGRKNSDLSEQEVLDLIAMLNYHLLVAKGEIIPDE